MKKEIKLTYYQVVCDKCGIKLSPTKPSYEEAVNNTYVGTRHNGYYNHLCEVCKEEVKE